MFRLWFAAVFSNEEDFPKQAVAVAPRLPCSTQEGALLIWPQPSGSDTKEEALPIKAGEKPALPSMTHPNHLQWDKQLSGGTYFLSLITGGDSWLTSEAPKSHRAKIR